MFSAAYEKARQFTHPVVTMWKLLSGECHSSIGSFVLLNDQGWIITANHIVKQIFALDAATRVTKGLLAQRETIKNDSLLPEKERRRQIGKLGIRQDSPELFGVWYGIGNQQATVQAWISLDIVDLAIGQLVGFTPMGGTVYPKFRNPNNSTKPGTSLCKMGFPFHSFTPTIDPLSGLFQFPQGALPMPFFPLEGMFTREISIPMPPGGTSNYPLKLIETSSPGLKGQSGGPIFDTDGNIWAIQTHTDSLELGFTPRVKNGGTTEHQFLNVGRGAHIETILGLLTESGVGYEQSS